VKTAISVPESTFRAAERFANQHRLSRSELYSKALKEYLERHEPTTITERINALCQEVDTTPDTFLQNLSARVLHSEPFEDWS
jgi:metal-responsive CopG/Arc/MetJ family transcriptional regulator